MPNRRPPPLINFSKIFQPGHSYSNLPGYQILGKIPPKISCNYETIEDGPYVIDEGDKTNLSDGISEESGSDDENSIVEAQTAATPTVELATAAQSKTIPSLANISDDPLINKDAKFLDIFQNAFEANETSVVFKSHLKKMKAAFYEARRSVKKRIREASSNTVLEQEDEGNFFDILENM